MNPPNGKSELEKMRSFEWYCSEDPELIKLRKEAATLFRELNQTGEDSKSYARRQEIYKQLFGKVGENLGISPPFYCDYGKYIFFGNSVFLNFGCVILDGCDVIFGNNVMMGPYCQIYSVFHPFDAEERKKDLQNHKPVKIGNNVWFGGGVVLCPGVNIGDNCVIGTGSVVTKSIPENCLAFGNPCKVVREIKRNEGRAML